MKISTVHLPQRRMLAGVAIGALVGVVGVGAVTAASPSPSGPSGPVAPSVASGAPGTPGLRDVLALGTAAGPDARRDVIRKAIARNFRIDVAATNQGGTHNLLYVRGTLQVGAASVTVTLPDTSTQTFSVDGTTIVREKGQTVPFTDLKDGDRAMVFGVKNEDRSSTAKLIRRVIEPRVGPAAEAPAPTP